MLDRDGRHSTGRECWKKKRNNANWNIAIAQISWRIFHNIVVTAVKSNDLLLKDLIFGLFLCTWFATHIYSHQIFLYIIFWLLLHFVSLRKASYQRWWFIHILGLKFCLSWKLFSPVESSKRLLETWVWPKMEGKKCMRFELWQFFWTHNMATVHCKTHLILIRYIKHFLKANISLLLWFILQGKSLAWFSQIYFQLDRVLYEGSS